jgi:type I restriction enzyme S subunit
VTPALPTLFSAAGDGGVQVASSVRADGASAGHYANTRESGNSWLGRVPAHWGVEKLKFIARAQFSNVDKKTEDGEQPVRLCNYVDVYYHDRITADIDFMEATAEPREVAKFQLQPGDVLITKDSEDPNDICVPAVVAEPLPGVLCGYHLAQVRPDPARTHGPYLMYAFASSGIRDQFRMRANGITRFGLSQDDICSALFPLPPRPEQEAIAAWLDERTRRIDELVEAKRRLIDLLAEQRTASITHAVTKGLNPAAPMKPSGIDWLGDVPRHWEVAPLRRKWQVIDCKHRTVPFLDEGIPLASIGQVQRIDIDLSTAKKTSEEEYALLIEGERRPRRGDIIYSRNATVGEAAFVNTDETFCMGQDVCMIRSRDQDQRYLVHQLRSPVVMSQLDQMMVGATFKRINVADVKGLIVACPPPSEQREIAAYIDQTFYGTGGINGVIAAAEAAIARLTEYRQALISAAVTGRINVCGAGEGTRTRDGSTT